MKPRFTGSKKNEMDELKKDCSIFSHNIPAFPMEY